MVLTCARRGRCSPIRQRCFRRSDSSAKSCDPVHRRSVRIAVRGEDGWPFQTVCWPPDAERNHCSAGRMHMSDSNDGGVSLLGKLIQNLNPYTHEMDLKTLPSPSSDTTGVGNIEVEVDNSYE